MMHPRNVESHMFRLAQVATGATSRLALAPAMAAVLAGAALALSRGEFYPPALGLMTAALLVAFVAAVVRRRGERPVCGDATAARRLLAAAAVLSCGWHVLVPPGSHLVPPHPAAFRVLAVGAVALCATYLWGAVPPWMMKFRFWTAVACFAGMSQLVLHHSPMPFIDVWWIQQIGARALLDGSNPYSILYPNFYGHTRWFAPELIENGAIAFYPYPPLSLAVGSAGFALGGDVRIALLLLVIGAAWLLRRAGRASHLAEIAALALLFQPVSFVMIEKAWSEPVVLTAMGLTVCAVGHARRESASPFWVSGAAGLLLASKQFSPILAVPLLFALPRLRRVVTVVVAVAIAAATLLPFAVWDPGELWRDLGASLFLQPFRYDALSWLAAAARALGGPLPWALGVAALLAVLAATVRPGATVAQAVLAASAGLLAFLLFNKQAFLNYYWLAVGLLLFATALSEHAPHAALRPGAAGTLEAHEDAGGPATRSPDRPSGTSA